MHRLFFSDRCICIDCIGLDPALPPNNMKAVHAFIGILSFYRRSIKNFSVISKPLINLTRNNVKFIWDGSCQQPFETLKHDLITAPILAFPRLDKQFILCCNASNYGIRAVLLQEVDGIEKPVYFLSQSLSKTHRRWCIFEIEAYAIMYALNKLDHYLADTSIPFIIRTNHHPLESLHNSKQKNRKLQM